MLAVSEHHKNLARRCFPWVRSRMTPRGFRGALEVPLAIGWVADVAILGSFQYRHYVKYSDRCVKYGHPCLGAYSYWLMIFEVKVSRPDFASTFKATGNRHADSRQTGFGNLHWLVVSRGLVEPLEVPPLWGILEQRPTGLREIRRPEFCGIGELRKAEVAETILWKPSDER